MYRFKVVGVFCLSLSTLTLCLDNILRIQKREDVGNNKLSPDDKELMQIDKIIAEVRSNTIGSSQNSTTNATVPQVPTQNDVMLPHTQLTSDDNNSPSKRLKEKPTVDENDKSVIIPAGVVQKFNMTDTGAANNETVETTSFCFPSVWSADVERHIYNVGYSSGNNATEQEAPPLTEQMSYSQFTNHDIKRTVRSPRSINRRDRDNVLTYTLSDGDITTYVQSNKHCLLNKASEPSLASNMMNIRCLEEYYNSDVPRKQTDKQVVLTLKEENKKCYTVLTTNSVTGNKVKETKFCVKDSAITVKTNNGKAIPLKQMVHFTEEIGEKLHHRKAILWFTNFKAMESNLNKERFDVPAACLPKSAKDAPAEETDAKNAPAEEKGDKEKTDQEVKLKMFIKKVVLEILSKMDANKLKET